MDHGCSSTPLDFSGLCLALNSHSLEIVHAAANLKVPTIYR